MATCNLPGFYLLLNPNYDRAEVIRAFGPFATAKEALQFHSDEQLKDVYGFPASEFIEGNHIYYHFRVGPLRHMNALSTDEQEHLGHFGHGLAVLREVQSLGWFSASAELPTSSTLSPL